MGPALTRADRSQGILPSPQFFLPLVFNQILAPATTSHLGVGWPPGPQNGPSYYLSSCNTIHQKPCVPGVKVTTRLISQLQMQARTISQRNKMCPRKLVALEQDLP